MRDMTSQKSDRKSVAFVTSSLVVRCAHALNPPPALFNAAAFLADKHTANFHKSKLFKVTTMSFKFALVEWTEGKDDGLRSILPIDCVRGFNLENYHKDQILMVEWRKGKKSQWQVYQARILEIAGM